MYFSFFFLLPVVYYHEYDVVDVFEHEKTVLTILVHGIHVNDDDANELSYYHVHLLYLDLLNCHFDVHVANGIYETYCKYFLN